MSCTKGRSYQAGRLKSESGPALTSDVHLCYNFDALPGRCPDTERVKSGGVDVLCLLLVKCLPARHPNFSTPSLPHYHTFSNPITTTMVSTRKKDYGSAPLPKRPKRPLNDFTLFSRLPFELQLMIWKASMTPRLIAVGPKGPGTPLSHHSKKILPSLFPVNQGSRYCALRHYSIRLTISLTVDETGEHLWDCPEFQSTTYHANVVSKQLPIPTAPFPCFGLFPQFMDALRSFRAVFE